MQIFLKQISSAHLQVTEEGSRKKFSREAIAKGMGIINSYLHKNSNKEKTIFDKSKWSFDADLIYEILQLS